MKVPTIFLGTPDIAAEILKSISSNENIDIVAVITAPDKKQGRKMQIKKTEVKTVAEELKIPVYTPSTKEELHTILAGLDFELAITAAYGLIIPEKTLDLAKFLNIHFSLLPKYRGASPIQASLLNGDKVTGVTIFELSKKMDCGDIIDQAEVAIDQNDDLESLSAKLINKAVILVTALVLPYLKNEIDLQIQDDNQSSYCYKITKKDGLIDFDNDDCEKVINKIRAFKNWPTTYSYLAGKILKILEAKKVNHLEEEADEVTNKASKGQIIIAHGKIYVILKDGPLEIQKLQMEGKNPITAKEFIAGYANLNGSTLG